MVDFDGGGIIGFDFVVNATETITMVDGISREVATEKSDSILWADGVKKDISLLGSVMSETLIFRDGDDKYLFKEFSQTVQMTGSRAIGVAKKPSFDQITFKDKIYKVLPDETYSESMTLTDVATKGPSYAFTQTITLTDLKTTSYEQSVAKAPSLRVNIFSSSATLSINTPALRVNR